MKVLMLCTANINIILRKLNVFKNTNNNNKYYAIVFNINQYEMLKDKFDYIYLLNTESRINPFKQHREINKIIRDIQVDIVLCFYNNQNGEGYSNIRVLLNLLKCKNKLIINKDLDEIESNLYIKDYFYEIFFTYEDEILGFESKLISLLRKILRKKKNSNTILFYNYSITIGGVEKLILSWSKMLIKHGFNVVMYCESLNIPGISIDKLNMMEEYISSCIDVIVQDNNKSFKYCLRKHKPNTIVFCGKQPTFKELLSFEVLSTTHLLKMYNSKIHKIEASKRFDYYVKNFCNNIFDKTIGISESVVNNLLELGVNRNKVKLIYGSSINSLDYENYQLKQSKEVTTNNIVCISRLAANKGVDILIRSIQSIRSKLENTKVYIVGDGPERERLELLVKQFNLEKYISFEGYSNDISLYLNKSKFLVLSSHEEGLGLVLIEAMIHKKCVIASNVGGIPEVVKHGYNGLLFEDSDYVKLGNYILYLLKNEKILNRYNENAYKTVVEKFDLQKIVSQFIELVR